jgi:hypothetical protein
MNDFFAFLYQNDEDFGENFLTGFGPFFGRG